MQQCDAVIIEELRELFRNGATPSRLMHHVRNRFPGEKVSMWVIQAYFEQAFCLGMVRGISPAMDVTNPRTFPSLNKRLILEMVHSRNDWNTLGSHSTDPKSWFDHLETRSEDEVIEMSRLEPHSFISAEGWQALGPDDQQMLRAHFAGNEMVSERVQILATLAERLQQQVEELEERLANFQLAESPGVS